MCNFRATFFVVFPVLVVAAADEMTVYRLPADTRPISYDLVISPDYDSAATGSMNFDGEVEIVICPTTSTSRITLNCKDLVVYVAYVREKETDKAVNVVGVAYNHQNEQISIKVEFELDVLVHYVVDIEYYGTIENSTTGFYKSTYTNPDAGSDEWLFLTYSEPTSARSIFPCYDEPAYKTPFNVSLKRPVNKSSRSNMPNYTTNYDKSIGSVSDIFIRTPPMSTHMVVFVISAFNGSTTESLEGESPVYTFTRNNYLPQIRYVSEKAPELLKAMENFTEIQYNLPKFDMFAVPDLKSNSMGNWGLTTFREKFLVLDDTSTTKAKEIGLSMIQREIARQWFGNLVSCSWWDYLWLHDAFTTYFQYFSIHMVYPDWNMDQIFVVEQHQLALAYDQTPKHAITASVRSPVEINDAFYDQMSRKSASFLRMLKFVTNHTIFQQSLVQYLKRNKYESVNPDVLFAAFENTISEYQYDFGKNITVTDFMKQWTEQAGYPMVSVLKINDMFVITQERFLIDTPDKIVDLSKWFVGITYTTESNKNFENFTLAKWCEPSMDECVLSAPLESGWFIFNLQSTGFYRVNYDEENWRSLIGQLKNNPTEINILNRAQLVDDSFNLARADKLHYSIPLQLSSYLKIENDVIPWYSAINGYSYILERMRRDDADYVKLRECVGNLAGIIYKKMEELVVRQNNTDHIILTSWNTFSVWACELDNTICTQSAFDYYKKWQNGEKIPTDIRDAAFCVGIRLTNNTSTWEQMFDVYKTTSSTSEKQAAQTALACTTNDELLSRYLNYIFVQENSPIRAQDYNDVFIAISSTPKGLNALIDFLIENINNISMNLNDGDKIAISIYAICSSKAALDNEISRIENLKDDPNTPDNLRQAFNESYKEVNNNLYWYNKYHEIINQNMDCYPEYNLTTEQPFDSTTQPFTEYTKTVEPETTIKIETQSTTESTTIKRETSTQSSTSIETKSTTIHSITTESLPSTALSTEVYTIIETTQLSTSYPSTLNSSVIYETTTIINKYTNPLRLPSYEANKFLYNCIFLLILIFCIVLILIIIYFCKNHNHNNY